MSTSVWPPISPEELVKKEEASLARELEWLLASLQETFAALKAGLEECAALLAPDNGAATLVMSSQRSESLKGFVTRIGTRIVKGDINIRLATLPPPRNAQSPSQKLSISTAPAAPTLVLSQLTSVRTLINTCLDIIDVSRWTGDAKNADFIAGQLRLLAENMQEARGTLRGGPSSPGWREWWEEPVEEGIFEPPLPPNLAFHLAINDAALVLHIRTLQPLAQTPSAGGGGGSSTPLDSITGYSLRERLAVAVGASSRPASHDESSETFMWKGGEVRVREKVRVESQDPSLLSAMAKLSALEHSVAMSRRALATVMGADADEE